jgi:hypothetical protein
MRSKITVKMGIDQPSAGRDIMLFLFLLCASLLPQ